MRKVRLGGRRAGSHHECTPPRAISTMAAQRAPSSAPPPRQALLLLRAPVTDASGVTRRLLPRERHLCCELLLWVYLDSCSLDATKESLITQLYLWEPTPPPSTADERRKFLDNSICGPATQLSNLETDEGAAWAREETGIPVWVVSGGGGNNPEAVPAAVGVEVSARPCTPAAPFSQATQVIQRPGARIAYMQQRDRI